MNLYSFSTLIFSSGVFLISILALVKRKDKIAIRFFLFSVCIFGWGFLFSFWISQNYSPETTLTLARLAAVFVVFIPITWLHFILTFLEKKEPARYFYFLNYSCAVFFALISQTPLIFKGVHPIIGFKYIPTPGVMHHFHLLFFCVLVPYGFYHLFRSYFSESGQRKEQLKYLLVGTLSGFVAGGSVYLVFYQVPFPLILLALMPLYPILTGIALIRYGLFDVHQIADAFRRDKLAAIGTLAASLNHEIRNPLYIIQGLAESHLANVNENIYPDQKQEVFKTREILQKTAEQATRALDIMRSFSVFAKQGTKQVPHFEAFPIMEVVENIFPLIRHELELDKIDLICEIPAPIPPIRADRRHVEEILFNLIVNSCQAIKHAVLETRGKIKISAGQRNGKVQIRVEDNGPGIPPNQLSQIFEPFYTTKAEGTGLGLYVTRQLIEKNGGKISVTSKPEKGTVFSLEFRK